MKTQRIKIIYDLSLLEQPAIINALVACLSPKEACELLLNALYVQSVILRRYALRKISVDIEKGFLDCHRKLIERLLTAYDKSTFSQKQIYAQCFSSFYHLVSKNFQKNIIFNLINSKYISMRRKAYKLLKTSWNEEYLSLLEERWKANKDFDLAEVIIKCFPLSFLNSNIDELEKLVSGTWLLRKLYLRLGEREHNIVRRLEKIDEITFVYVSTKLGIPIEEEKLKIIYKRNKKHENASLLIWCFGQMGLWNVLISFLDKTNEKNF